LATTWLFCFFIRLIGRSEKHLYWFYLSLTISYSKRKIIFLWIANFKSRKYILGESTQVPQKVRHYLRNCEIEESNEIL
tara:strand:- start:262 stop:498 length:237 start_codon:yes stop_codon:yes gene_type:complete